MNTGSPIIDNFAGDYRLPVRRACDCGSSVWGTAIWNTVLVYPGALAEGTQRISRCFDTYASIVEIAAVFVLGFFIIRYIVKKSKTI